MRQLKQFMKAKKPMWRCGECECITLKCWRENDEFCNCGTSSEGTGVEYAFKDWDGTILKKWSIDEWATPKAPADPTREGYTFTWWEPEVWPLNSDTTYVAQYEAIIPVVSMEDIPYITVTEWETTTLTTTYSPTDANDFSGITFELDEDDLDSSYTWRVNFSILSHEDGTITLSATWTASWELAYRVFKDWNDMCFIGWYVQPQL